MTNLFQFLRITFLRNLIMMLAMMVLNAIFSYVNDYGVRWWILWGIAIPALFGFIHLILLLVNAVVNQYGLYNIWDVGWDEWWKSPLWWLLGAYAVHFFSLITFDGVNAEAFTYLAAGIGMIAIWGYKIFVDDVD